MFLLLASTADTLTELFLVHSCKQERERSRLSRGPHFLNLRSPACTHWSMQLRWASSHCSVSSRIRDQGFKRAHSSWEEFASWLFLESLHFVARGRFLRCLYNFQYLVAGISYNPRSSSVVSHTNSFVLRVGSHATALKVPFIIFHKASWGNLLMHWTSFEVVVPSWIVYILVSQPFMANVWLHWNIESCWMTTDVQHPRVCMRKKRHMTKIVPFVSL